MLDGLVSFSGGLAQSSSQIALLLLLLSSLDIVENSNRSGGQLLSMQPSDVKNAFETTSQEVMREPRFGRTWAQSAACALGSLFGSLLG